MTEKPILSIETYKDLDKSNRYFEHLSRCSEGLKKYDEKEEKQMKKHTSTIKQVFAS